MVLSRVVIHIFPPSFDGKKKKRGTRDFNEKQKLLHKHKKEMKGARREIKKDNQFLARQKLHEQLEKYVPRYEPRCVKTCLRDLRPG